MVKTDKRERPEVERFSGSPPRILIVESPYYREITDELVAGAAAVLDQVQAAYDRIAVPGALEIPQALAQAVTAGLFAGGGKGVYAGAIALGCVIRGETAHYDIVCNNTNHWLMDTAIRHQIPIGNGVLTVDSKAQAFARASGGADGKGGDAARACLRLVKLAGDFRRHAS